MKTILVTGGYGFIGSEFIRQQIAEGNKIINLDALTYAANKDNLQEVEGSSNYQFIHGDIADEAVVAKIFADNKIDWVVNFAAESHVDNSISNPRVFLETNILGTYNLLQNAKQYWEDAGKPTDFRFLHVSTDEVYGSLELDDPKFDEENQYQPNSPYSASKAASDHLVRAWYHTYGLPTITTNCSNNFGANQHGEKLIPKVIERCITGQDITIYGTGKAIRDWIYVGDHARGISQALQSARLGETYCFGGNAERDVNQMIDIITSHLDEVKGRADGKSYKSQIVNIADRAGHDMRYAINDNKARKELGFAVEVAFDERIKQVINSYI